MVSLVNLRDRLATLGRVLLGYSGGVDSAVLAVSAVNTLGPKRFLAAIGRSASYPDEQYRIATDLAARFSIPIVEVDTDELDDPRYRANPTNRCFFCKQELWRQLGRVADDRGFDTVIDGTNADDLQGHRPGSRAGREALVVSPLADLGWSKADVRHAAQVLGLPIWDAPAAPCLASRVRYGIPVTAARLEQVERAEAYLRALGVRGDLRVRHLGAGARVEVGSEAMPLVRAQWGAVVRALMAEGFATVELDPRGYRSGSLLATVDA